VESLEFRSVATRRKLKSDRVIGTVAVMGGWREGELRRRQCLKIDKSDRGC
jgi:hypothetical protein